MNLLFNIARTRSIFHLCLRRRHLVSLCKSSFIVLPYHHPDDLFFDLQQSHRECKHMVLYSGEFIAYH